MKVPAVMSAFSYQHSYLYLSTRQSCTVTVGYSSELCQYRLKVCGLRYASWYGSVISASVSVSDHCSFAVLLNCLCVQCGESLKMPWKLDDLPSG